MRPVRTVVVCMLLSAALPGGAAGASAELLSDPTRPSFAEGQGETRATSGPVLQSVISSGGHRTAIINGQTLRVGDRLGDAKLIAIGEAQVTLARAGETQVLKLYTGFTKEPVANAAGTAGKNRDAKKKAEK